MPSLRQLPQELVDKIIDELGKDYRDPDHKRYFDDRIGVLREALRACTLVSKNWTGRSRAQLFKEVDIRASDGGSFVIPPGAVMPYIMKLEMRLRYTFSRLSPSQDLLKRFYACPIVCLELTEGELTTTRVYLMEFITAISATLRTVTIKECSFLFRLIHDIVLAHPDLERLHFHSCRIESTGSDRPTTSHLGASHSTDLDLGLFSTLDPGVDTHLITAIAQFPIKFCRLNFGYVQRPDMIPLASALIEANAESLSSLTVHFVTCMSKVLSKEKISPLTIKPYCRGLSARQQPSTLPGKVFQLIRVDFAYGEGGLLPRYNLRQHYINPQSKTTHPLGADQVDDEMPLPMERGGLLLSLSPGVEKPRHPPL